MRDNVTGHHQNDYALIKMGTDKTAVRVCVCVRVYVWVCVYVCVCIYVCVGGGEGGGVWVWCVGREGLGRWDRWVTVV